MPNLKDLQIIYKYNARNTVENWRYKITNENHLPVKGLGDVKDAVQPWFAPEDGEWTPLVVPLEEPPNNEEPLSAPVELPNTVDEFPKNKSQRVSKGLLNLFNVIRKFKKTKKSKFK